MTGMILRVRTFLMSDDGPTAVEYALLIGFIVVTIFAIVGKLGVNLSGTFNTVNNSVGSS